MAAKKKSTLARAQAGLTQALKDFEKTVVGMVSSPPAKKAKKAKAKKATKAKAKKKSAKK